MAQLIMVMFGADGEHSTCYPRSKVSSSSHQPYPSMTSMTLMVSVVSQYGCVCVCVFILHREVVCVCVNTA